jgi:hypothetical protein
VVSDLREYELHRHPCFNHPHTDHSRAGIKRVVCQIDCHLNSINKIPLIAMLGMLKK